MQRDIKRKASRRNVGPQAQHDAAMPPGWKMQGPASDLKCEIPAFSKMPQLFWRENAPDIDREWKLIQKVKKAFLSKYIYSNSCTVA